MGATETLTSGSNGAGSALVSLRGVHKAWGDRPILTGVDFDLHPGTVSGIAGGNGAGKTTLIRIAAGIIAPEQGTVSFMGADIEQHRDRYQRALGFLSAGDRGLYARLTVTQNLDFWGGLSGFRRSERRGRASDVLNQFDIVHLADARVDRLSMGQRQRVRLAQTFMHGPRVVFLDEPRTSLDEEGFGILERALSRLTETGGAALIATPEADDPLFTQSFVLRDGILGAYTANGASAQRSAKDAGLAVPLGAS